MARASSIAGTWKKKKKTPNAPLVSAWPKRHRRARPLHRKAAASLTGAFPTHCFLGQPPCSSSMVVMLCDDHITTPAPSIKLGGSTGLAAVSTRPAGLPHPWGGTNCTRKAAPPTYSGCCRRWGCLSAGGLLPAQGALSTALLIRRLCPVPAAAPIVGSVLHSSQRNLQRPHPQVEVEVEAGGVLCAGWATRDGTRGAIAHQGTIQPVQNWCPTPSRCWGPEGAVHISWQVAYTHLRLRSISR